MIGARLLEAAVLVLAALTAVALALLVLHGAAVRLARAAGGGRVTRGRRALLETVAGERSAAAASHSLRRVGSERALALLAELAPSLAGGEREALTAVARERGLVAHAERRCRSRLWRRRLHAVRVLGLLGGGEHAVPPLLGDPRPEVRAQAAEWAADHPNPETAERLVELLADPARFTRFTVMDSLIRLGAHGVEPLSRAIASGPPGVRADALRVAARIGDARLAEPAAACVADPDPEVRASAARLLGGLGGERHAGIVSGMLEDEAPGVRAAAAVALGRLGHWPSAPAVAAGLRDPVWQVRRDAALALRALGAPGELLLERALRGDDPFAADMARQTLDLPEAVLPA